MRGLQSIRHANARPVGAVEMREVRMRIGGPHGRAIELGSLRATEGERSQSIFCILRPDTFGNVNYVARERRGLAALEVTLYLPFAQGTLIDLAAARCGEPFLGSDFSYDDFRVWLPEEGFTYENPRDDPQGIRVRGRCVGEPGSWRHGAGLFEVVISKEDNFIVGIDYLGPGGGLVRCYRVEASTVIDGVRIPTCMTMRDIARCHETSIELIAARRNIRVETAMFDPGARELTREYLLSLRRREGADA